MNEYYNLVFIKHENCEKTFLFKVPINIQLKTNEKVFVETIRGEYLGTCVSDSFIVGEHETACIMMGTGAYYPLKEVIGRAKKLEGYRCIDFKLAEAPSKEKMESNDWEGLFENLKQNYIYTLARNIMAWDTSKDKSQGLLPEVYLHDRNLFKELTGEECIYKNIVKYGKF